MTKLLSISQKQTYFRPYFTQSYIRDIIRQNEISEYAKLFKNVKEYKATENKSNANIMYIEQNVYNVCKDNKENVERRLVLERDGSVWKVRNIVFDEFIKMNLIT
ncbi:hypothetical protein [Ureibacillus sp. GCM10028918]|uniref:hypothetical protein n=1 Tax=Ureibacillus sp. GCM10028918 TaxID=3273429 RepID=UPI00361B31CC